MNTNIITKLLTISRTRFWIYLIGPAIIGASLTFTNQFLLLSLLLIYFTLPANLLIYGVNDLADFDTDALNPKKDSFENRLKKSDKKLLINSIILTNTPFIPIFIWFGNWQMFFAWLIFLFFGIFYSLPPIRAKAIPFLDGFFNLLYIMPAIIGYFAFGGENLNPIWIFAGILWCIGMHAYSAIPDIESDQKAGLKTIATQLGYNKTLIYSWFCLVFPTLLFLQISYFSLFAALAYTLLIWQSRQQKSIFSMYKIFPLINSTLGFMLFLILILERIS